MLATETTGAGPDLVLVHGVGTSRAIFGRAVPILGEARRVTALDLPGFGQTPAPGDGWKVSSIAAQLALELEATVEAPFDLLGSSLGGAVALALASRHPQLIRRLILQAPAGFRSAPAPVAAVLGRVAVPWIAGRRLVGMAISDNRHARRAALAGTVADGAELSAEDARLVLGASAGAHSLSEAMAAAISTDLVPDLERLGAPLALIWGSLDRIVPPISAERILAIRPDTPIEWIAGSGHLPHVERPREFCAAVERAFSQLP